MGLWDNSILGPNAGVYHTAEIPMVFGSRSLDPSIAADSPNEAATVRLMMTAWTSFAKDPQNGLTNLGWPVYNRKGISFPPHILP
jgi:carboxylesterase type B